MPSKILEVLICTIDHRIEHALRVLLEPQPHIRYLIAWQQTSEAVFSEFELPEREDLRIIKSCGKGLAKNRNVALRNASGHARLLEPDFKSLRTLLDSRHHYLSGDRYGQSPAQALSANFVLLS